MNEQLRDNFLISIGENIDDTNTFIKMPKIIKKKDEVIKFNNKEIVLSYMYQNTSNLINCLNDALNNYKEKIKYKDNNIPKDYYLKCFNNFKKYIKDIIDLNFYTLKLDENNMTLIYNLTLKSIEDFNIMLIEENNKFADKLNKIETNYHNLVNERQRKAIIDSLNSPKMIYTTSYKNIFGDTVVTGDVYNVNKINSDGYNSYDSVLKNWDNEEAAKDVISDVCNKCPNIVDNLNKQLINILFTKMNDTFTKEDNIYLSRKIWIDLIEMTDSNNYEKINKCADFYNIDIKETIKEFATKEALNGKQISYNIINFYKETFKENKLDISDNLIKENTKKIIKLINSTSLLKDKQMVARKEYDKLKNIPYLNNDDINIIISNVEKEIDCVKNSIQLEKKKKDKIIIKRILIILLISIIILISAYFICKNINSVISFLPIIFTILIVFFIFRRKFKILKKILHR